MIFKFEINYSNYYNPWAYFCLIKKCHVKIHFKYFITMSTLLDGNSNFLRCVLLEPDITEVLLRYY